MTALISKSRPTIGDVFDVEREMLKQPQIELPVRHWFSPGVYARELTIYEGCVLTGAVHKYEQLNILSKGRMRLLTDDGFKEVEAPFTVVSPPGTKRIALALTECVWTTILHTHETDVPTIEKQFVCKTEQEYLEWHSQYLQSSEPSASVSQASGRTISTPTAKPQAMLKQPEQPSRLRSETSKPLT